MPYIKTPVAVTPHSMRIVDNDGLDIAICNDPKKLIEIANTINERDDLLAQRDALVEVAELLEKAAQALDLETAWLLKRDAMQKAPVALALVRGEEERQCHTT